MRRAWALSALRIQPNRWMKQNVHPHRGVVPVLRYQQNHGRAAWDVSADRGRVRPGQIPGFGEIACHEQNFVLPHIPRQAYERGGRRMSLAWVSMRDSSAT